MLKRWPRFGAFDTELNRLRGEMDRVFRGNGSRFARPATCPAMNLWEDDALLWPANSLAQDAAVTAVQSRVREQLRIARELSGACNEVAI